MKRMKVLPEVEYVIDVAMHVMRDTWNDKEMGLEEFKSGVLGNAEVIKKACEFMIEWAENYQEIYEDYIKLGIEQ